MKSGKTGQSNHDLVLEELEPRILLSADLAGGLADHATSEAHQQIDAAPLLENDSNLNTPQAADIAQRELVIVDISTPDYQQLIADIQASTDTDRELDVLLLDALSSGVEQISEALANQESLSAVHIISHGSEGSIALGNDSLNMDNLLRSARSIQAWGSALTDTGDILIYGCNLAADNDGQHMLEMLSNLTGADVAASDDPTGAAALGGDWDLEHRIGQVEARIAVSESVQQDYKQVLLETVHTEQTGQTSDFPVNNNSYGQTFAYNSGNGTYLANFVELELRLGTTSAAHSLTVEIRDGWNGTVLASGQIDSADMYVSDTPNDTRLERIKFSTAATLTDATTYTIKITPVPAAITNLSYISYNNASAYADGDVLNAGGSPVAGQDLFFRVGIANEAPVITSDGGGATAAVNAAENQTAVTTVTYSDADLPADPVLFSLSGPDAAHFTISPAGVLTFTSTQDFENPTDSDTDGNYEVTVTVNDQNGGTATQDITVTLTDGSELVGQYSFEEGAGTTATDTSGYGNDGALTNMDPGTDWVAGRVAGGLDFDGADDYVDLASPAEIDNIFENGGTVSAWVYAESAGGGGTGRIIAKSSNINTTTGWSLQMWASNRLRFEAGFSVNQGDWHTTADVIPFDTWTHVAVSYNSNSAANDPVLVVNGVAVALLESNTPGGTYNSDAALEARIGNETSFGAAGFDGVIDEVRLYREQLSVGEISLLANTPPVITSDGGGATANINAAENQTAVTTVTYTDPDVPADTILYSLSGDDAALFSISATGVLTFNSAPDFETPVDNDLNGIYEVTVTLDDQNGGTDVQALSITVIDANDAPVITSNGGGATALVNAAENQTAVTTVTYTDPDTAPVDTILYSLSGADASLFSISAGGVLTFNAVQNFENPGDANADGNYEVTVTLDDQNGGGASQDITVTLTDASEVVGNWRFEESSGTTAADSSGAGNAGTLVNMDPGTDWVAGKVGGALDFDGSDDYVQLSSNPKLDNVFSGGGTVSAWIFVESSGGNGQGRILSKAGDVLAVNGWSLQLAGADRIRFEAGFTGGQGDWQTTASTITLNTWTHVAVTYDSSAPGNDPIIYVDGVAQTLSESNTPSGSYIDDAAYDARIGNVSTETTRTFDGAIDEVFLAREILSAAQIGLQANNAPTITSNGGGASALVNAAENQTAVTTVTYTDPDTPADTILYSLSGDDAGLFSISGAGILSFNSAPDFENPTDDDLNGTYEVTVTIDDQRGGTDQQAMSVAVTDANDAPAITSGGGAAAIAVELDENLTEVTTVSYADADLPADTVLYSLSGDDASHFTISPTGVLAFTSAKNFENPDDFDLDGTYDVQVTIDDQNGGTDTQDIAITLLDINDAPVITSDGGGVVADISLAENQVIVTNVTATDEDLPVQSFTFQIGFGADDGAMFSISPTGVITFNSAPDFENPGDLDSDGVYEFGVFVYDGNGGVDVQFIDVTITDANDAPVITSNGGSATAAINAAENQTAVTTVTYTDQDIPADSILYSLSGDDAALFSISALGVLTFNAPPDRETPTDNDLNGIYEVTVTLDDQNGGTDVQAISVTVTDVNEAPVINSNGGGASTTINLAENQTAVTTVTYADPDVPADTILYSLSGDDAALFSISATGDLTFNSAPDFEAPTDNDLDGAYEVTVTLDDQNGGTDVQAITVNITDGNDAPIITSNGGGNTAGVNAAENQTAVTTVTYTDEDAAGDTILYTLAGDDAALFSISATGVLTFNSAPDREVPTDNDLNGVYEVTVILDDQNGGSDSQQISVTVTDVNDAPLITSDGGGIIANINAAENQTAVTTVTVSDQDIPANTILYSLSGNDSAFFSISPTGILSFNAAQNFESPADLNIDGVYEVTVTVDDQTGGTDSQALFVTVTDANDAPVITSNGGGATATINVLENQTTVTTVTYTDTDVPPDSILYSVSGTDAGLFSISTGGVLTFNAPQNFESPSDANGDGAYLITVAVNDQNGGIATQDITVNVLDDNDAPVITSNGGGAVALINAVENQTAVTTVTFTDQDIPADTILYSLSGDDAALFSISPTGVLTFVDAPDFEHPADLDLNGIYEVTVTLDDQNGGTDVQAISVTVTDINDAPAFAAGTAPEFTVAENTTIVGTPFVEDDDGDTLTYTLIGGDDVGRLSINSSTGLLTFNSPPSYDSPADLDSNNIYTVTMRVTDGNGGVLIDTVTVNVLPEHILTTTGSEFAQAGSVYTLNLSYAGPATITSWTINWGDGNIDTYAGNPSSVTHVYSNTGFTNNILASATDGVDVFLQSDIVITSRFHDAVDRLSIHGSALSTFDSAGLLDYPTGIEYGPDGNFYVVGFQSGNIVRFDGATNTLIDEFISDPAMPRPADLEFGPDGNLYVTSNGSDQIRMYDSETGNYIGNFVSTGSGGLDAPWALSFGPNGDLYVSSFSNDEIYRFDGTTGNPWNGGSALFVSSGSAGLKEPADITFGPDGNLYVASYDNDRILRFDAETGAPIGSGVFISGTNKVDGPAGIDFGPDGNLYVTNYNDDNVVVMDGTTGAFIKEFVADHAGRVHEPEFAVFVPGHQVTVDATAPVVSNNTGSNLNEGQTDILSNAELEYTDSQQPAANIIYTVTSAPANGQLELTSNPGVVITSFTQAQINANEVVYVHDGNESTSDSFNFTVADSTGNALTGQSFSFNITPVNDSPVITSNGGAATALINAAENQTTVTTVTYTDADIPADTILYSLSGADAALFSISATGVLTFNSAPNLENPTDANLDGVYEVTVTLDDQNGGTDLQALSITVTDVNDAPVITSNGGAATALINTAENQTAVTTLTYTDEDLPADSILYSLSGDDAALFSISATGVLTFNAAPDFETPLDNDLNGVYEVTVTLDDQNGGTDVQALSITVVDQNDAPIITSDGGGATAAMNAAENQTAVTTVTYTDQDLPADTILYSLSGADAALFSISPTGVLTFNSAPDFENPVDNDLNGVYEVTVTLDDQNGGTDVQALSITVVDQNDAPIITSDGGLATAAINAAENQTAVTTVTYTDQDLPADTILYSLSGDDAALFSISPTGVLTFNAAPDFETPLDNDLNGVYEVTVTLDDQNGGSDVQALSITVTDVNDAPIITSDGGLATAAINAAENQTAVTTVTYTDQDLPADTILYSLSGDDAALFSISPTGVLTFNSAPDFENPVDNDLNGVYEVTVTLDDQNGGTDVQALSITVTDVNDAPIITSDGGLATAAINAAENQTAVTAVTYTDQDLPADTILYSLSGADAALFSISATGVLTFNAAPDFETPLDNDLNGVYEVTVTLDDQNGGTDVQALSITVVDQNDAPIITSDGGLATAALNAAENQTAVTTVTYTDQDLPADSILYSLSGADAALFSISATGVLTFNAAPDFETPLDNDLNGVYEVTVTLDDQNGGTDVQALSITVTDVNDAPIITSDGGLATAAINAAENQTAVTTVTYTDQDLPADTILYSLSGADAALFSISATGVLTFNAAPDFETPLDNDLNGVYEVTVTLNDQNGGTDVQTLSITVTDVNDAPIITSDGGAATALLTAAENQTAVTTVTYTDQDLPADSILYSLSGDDAGLFSISATGVLTFNSAPDFETPLDNDLNGVYEVTVTLNDQNGGTDVQALSITVTDVNDAPIITSDGGLATAALNAAENQTAVTTVTYTDQDLPADTILYSLSGDDAALFSISATGVLTFNSAPDFENPVDNDLNGVYEVTVTLDDQNGGSDVQALSITVTDVNDAPIITSDGGLATAALNAAENQTAVTTVTYTDQDLPADSILYSLSGDDAGLFSISATGVLTFNSPPDFENPLDNDLDGVYEVTVTLDDQNGGTDVQALSVTVTDVNDAPIITSDGGLATAAINAPENQTAVTTVTYTDQDLPADTILYTLSGDDAALFSISPTGVLTFNSAPDFENPVDNDLNGVYEVTVTLDDQNGGTDVQALSVTVVDQNDAPIITSDGGAATALLNAAENQTAVTTVTYTDQDLPADTILYSLSGDDAALFSISATGVLTFNTAPDFETPLDNDLNGVYEVTVMLDDQNGGTDVQALSITVTDVNDAPIITSDGGLATAAINAAENQTAVTTVTYTDQDLPADTILYSLSGADAALFSISATGVLTFNAAPDFENPLDNDLDGVYEVTVTLDDQNGGTDVQALSITVTDVNDAPIITSDGGLATAAINAAENQTAVTTVTYTDQDLPADTILYSLSGADAALFSISPTGVLTFNSAPDFENPVDNDLDGVYEVTVTLDDQNGGTDVQAMSITVTDVNDAPIITSDGGLATAAINAAENQTAVTTVTYTDQDLPADTILYSLSGDDAALFSISATGVLSFNAAPDLENPVDSDLNGVYEVTVALDDQNGGTDVQALSITVVDQNDAPIITSNGGGATAALNAAENQTAVTTVTYTDQDVPANSIIYSLAGADAALFSISPAGILTFTGPANFESPTDANSDGVYEVTVIVNDQNGGTDSQAISVTVTDVNDGPVANNDTYSIDEDNTLIVGAAQSVSSNDSDEDGDVLSVNTTPLTTTTNGTLTLNADGTFTYTPDENFNGSDTFSYAITDPDGVTATAQVNITINPVNDSPVTIDDFISAFDDAGLIAQFDSLIGNDLDVDGDILRIVRFGQPANGVLVNNGDGSFGYFPYDNFSGIDSFTYTVADPDGAEATAIIFINVIASPTVDVPEPPELIVDDASTQDDADDDTSTGTAEKAAAVTGQSAGGGTADSNPLTLQAMTQFSTGLAGMVNPDEFSNQEDSNRQNAFSKAAVILGQLGNQYEVQAANLSELFIQQIGFTEALDDMRRQLDDAAGENANGVALTQVAAGTGIAMSVGLLSWILQGGALATSLVSVMPMWRTLDPLPLLAARRRNSEKKKQDKNDSTKNVDANSTVNETSNNLNELFMNNGNKSGDKQ